MTIQVPLSKIIEKLLNLYKTKLFLAVLGEWAILWILMNFGVGEIGVKNLTAALISVTGITVGLSVLLVRSLQKTIDTERKLLDVKNEAVERQYRELSDAYEKYRCLVHDEKHMILYLSQCLENDKIEEALKFLRYYKGNVMRQGKQAWTGISTLDFMLNMKKNDMDKLLIDFQLDCSMGNIPMEDADFVVVLGNLFDNAIEAVGRCKVEKRKINLSMKSINQMFILEMRNTSTTKPKTKNNRFITSKPEVNKHGWGIESIRYIVKKYNGSIEFQYDETFFEASILINEEQGIPCGGKGIA